GRGGLGEGGRSRVGRRGRQERAPRPPPTRPCRPTSSFALLVAAARAVWTAPAAVSGRSCGRERHGADRAAADLARQLDLPAVPLDDPPDDRQSPARPAQLPAAGLVHPPAPLDPAPQPPDAP